MAEAIHRVLGRLDDTRVVGETEIVVGTQVDAISDLAQSDLPRLRRNQLVLVFPEPVISDAVERALEPLVEVGSAHQLLLTVAVDRMPRAFVIARATASSSFGTIEYCSSRS